eukprot:jgi/Bigna1/145429/aug1.99_g20137
MSSKREDQHLIGQFDTAKLPAREGTEYTTMVNTIKSIVGTGVLTLPYAISVAGIIPGMISFAMTALGFTGRLIGSINIVMLEILVGAGYIVFVGRNFASVGGDLEGLAVFMGSTVFMFSGHAEVVAIVKPMKDRSKYPKVLVISVGTLFLIYLVFGLVVYISFGEKTEGLIFENMSGNLVAVTKVFHSLAILFSIPVKLWPAFENVTLQTRITSVGIRLSLLIATGAVAILVPDFAFLVAFCGSFCITLVGLVLPPLMYIILW